MSGNKMIGTVFFLAFAAPFIAAQYPETTTYATNSETVYPQPALETTTGYQSSYPESTSKSSYPESTSGPAYPEYTSGPAYPESTSGPAYPEYTSGPAYPESTSGPAYPESTSGPAYPESTSGPGYPKPTSGPGYPKPTSGPAYPKPTSGPGYPSTASQPNYPPPTYESGYDTPAPYGNGNTQGSYQAPVNTNYDPYANFPVVPVRNIRQEVDDDSASSKSVLIFEEIQNSDLDIIERKINETTSYGKKFEQTIYGDLVASVDAQDRKIENYRAQIDALSNVDDRAKSLANDLNVLISELKNIRTTNDATLAIINQLETTNGAQGLGIVVVEDQVDGNDQLIQIINTTRSSNVARNAAFVKELGQVIDIVNQERAESFTLKLTAANSSVRINYGETFPTAPQVTWSIIGIDINEINNSSSSSGNNEYRSGSTGNNEYRSGSTGNNEYRSGSTGSGEYRSGSTGSDEYRSGSTGSGEYRGQNTGAYDSNSASYDESINPRVTVSGDAKGATVQLVDSSKGWRTESVTVRLLAFYVNNDRSSGEEYRSTTPQGQYSTEEVTYSSQGGKYPATEANYPTTEAKYTTTEASYIRGN